LHKSVVFTITGDSYRLRTYQAQAKKQRPKRNPTNLKPLTQSGISMIAITHAAVKKYRSTRSLSNLVMAFPMVRRASGNLVANSRKGGVRPVATSLTANQFRLA
ncbi:MAG: hypothetical protein OXI06_04105, partial [bacterium]|nr:hypothetical protein [bacterium]